jgi:hypothetical protein
MTLSASNNLNMMKALEWYFLKATVVIIKAFCLNAADFNLYLWIHKNRNPPNPAYGRFKTLEVFKIL